MRLTLSIAASLAIAVSGCNKPPVASAASHPPAADVTCPADPAALSDAQILADPGGLLEAQFNDEALIAGWSCRDALARVCKWHKARGDVEVERCRSN
jgi:hypothetical protein